MLKPFGQKSANQKNFSKFCKNNKKFTSFPLPMLTTKGFFFVTDVSTKKKKQNKP